MFRGEVMNDAEGEEKDSGRNRRKHDERDIDYAMEALSRAAVLAGGEVALVVTAHFWR